MCGVGAVVGLCSDACIADSKVLVDDLIPVLSNRGPDMIGTEEFHINELNHVSLIGGVLSLRADTIGNVVRQPLTHDTTGDILCWNGELFGGVENIHGNDTTIILNLLANRNKDESSVQDILETIEGPFGFIYYEANSKKLWFGRDKLGRRSLLLGIKNNHLIITSTSCMSLKDVQWLEIDTKGIFCIDLTQTNHAQQINITQYLWKHTLKYSVNELFINMTNITKTVYEMTEIKVLDNKKDDDEKNEQKNEEKKKPELQAVLPYFLKSRLLKDEIAFDDCVTRLHNALKESVRLRVENIAKKSISTTARVGILFSGGIDCMIIAALVDEYIPKNEPIDLINAVFAGNLQNEQLLSLAPDRITAVTGLQELKMFSPERDWRLVEVDLRLEQLQEKKDTILSLLNPCKTIMDFNIGSVLYFASRAQGKQIKSHESWVPDSNANNNLCRYQDPNASTNQFQDKKGHVSTSRLVDRILPNKEDEQKDEQEDNDIKNDNEEYTSNCVILLSGLGADEQLAGYGRHRTMFKNHGLDALNKELQKDCCRIWKRNLGRDDRMISDSGKELRVPFLDENVMQCIAQLPLEHICDLREPAGKGDKKILRALAARMNLLKSSTLQKRAMQFGSRIANRKVAGYVAMTDEIKISDIVHPDFLRDRKTGEKHRISEYLDKKVNKKKHKPGFV